MDERKSTSARIWRDEEGIIHVAAIGIESTAETVAESLGIVRELSAGEPAPVLFDSTDWPKGDPASWVRFISTIESVCSAAAVVVTSASAPALGRFPEFIDDLVIPFRVFEDEAMALSFLRGYLTK